MQELLIANNVVGIVSLVVAVYLIVTFSEFMRNKEKALEMYLNAIFLEAKERDLNGVEVAKIEDNLKQRYADKIKQLGGEWPDFSIFKSSI